MQKSTVLILGAGSKLGTMLRKIWSDRPPARLNLCYQSRGPLSGSSGYQWAPGQSPDLLPACDTVIALWGQTSGDLETLSLNAALAGHSRAVALSCGASRVLHLSSAAVYGAADNASEADEPAPLNPYGLSKLALEARVSGFDDPGLHHCCLRVANLMGADSLAPALSGEGPVTLDRFADGKGPLRSYVGARDLADIFCALASMPAADLPAILNVAAPQPVAMQDLAEAAGKEVIWRDAPENATQRITLDTKRLTRLLPDCALTSDAKELYRQWQQDRIEP